MAWLRLLTSQPGEQIAGMFLDSRKLDHQRVGDLLIGCPLSKQTQDFLFPLAEGFDANGGAVPHRSLARASKRKTARSGGHTRWRHGFCQCLPVHREPRLAEAHMKWLTK